ncbi:sodium-dependent phosphate transporter 2-like [Physella acuta]|uniref:sodium-dependent phosphate transporter 2-like n=1 Tax=Physella acuta TaxID=109671 RepID=UPI0027DD0CF1|nr:sodium-dependent phosphate transporter 2-like [Physella acuta]XP_059144543.1 sodium-dependent phosphate transporter 2-like [Physella acuta]XP_059144544.1 sodium-dependent phosphate transporter 2-like [Physella acuta]XP_059144545.1 sodium-dependent phosphate transporter 2-like [Physella acuta]XP_059144546.1 sodium-dependent phosphate transporter 2-like [Physella acuta]XP_059144547.1 sodium-dependent phosphate transporter 2-like [Physella acuta]XP_059144548.1 sodium-dependent phosphate trans
MSDIPDEWLWIVIVGFIISFLLAFGIGANDVANTFGTSVGSKVITLLKACILASIFEILGAVLIGYRVSDTIRKGIIDVEPYNNSEKLLLMGNLCALTGSCVWMFVATFLSLPVSATHSIVGATVGFSLVAMGAKGVGWMKLGLIVASWFISPVMSGGISALFFIFVRKFVLNKEKPLEPGLKLLPMFYAFTICINAISIFLDGSELLGFDKIPLYGTFIISIGLAVITALFVRLYVVPWMRRKIQGECDVELQDTNLIEKEQNLDELKSQTYNYSLVVDPPDDGCNGTESKIGSDVMMTKLENGGGDNMMVTILDGPDMPNGAANLHNGATNLHNGDAKHHVPLVDEFTEARAMNSTTALLGTKGLSESAEKLPANGKDQTNCDEKGKKLLTRAAISDKKETTSLFSFLQILTAIFGSFAHGGNDVSNAIGPLVALWVISNEQSVSQKAPTPIWILLYGGAGISIGLWVLGRRVIKTMGEDLSKITPSSGFCIEIGAALTVLIASNVGIPISTTHCKVGSIVFTGRVRSNDNVDWSLFRNILIAWVVTLPASGLLSALMMYLLKEFAL